MSFLGLSNDTTLRLIQSGQTVPVTSWLYIIYNIYCIVECVLMWDMQCAGCVSARWWCWAARTAAASCRRPTWTSTARRTRGCAAATHSTSATRGTLTVLRMRKQNIYFDLIEWNSELFWIEADIRMISFSRGQCYGSGAGSAGSVCFWASWIRIH